MALAQAFLHSLLGAYAVSAAPAPRLEIDAEAILAPYAPPLVPQSFTALCRRALEGDAPAEDVLQQIEQLATGLHGAPERLAELTGHLQTITALGQEYGPDSSLAYATLDLATSPLTALVTVWHLEGEASEPPVSVVCLTGVSGAERVVRPRGAGFVERRLALRYTHADPYPLLEADALTTLAHEATPRLRPSWRQLPLPDYDLSLFTEQERPKGSVRTRAVSGPVSLRRPGLSLELAAAPGAQLLATELRDEHDRPLLRVLRWPPLSPEPPG